MYSPWTIGIDLLEACNRCWLGDAGSELLSHVQATRLVLYARFSSGEYRRVDGRQIERIDIQASAVTTTTGVHEVVAFPVLSSPHRVDLISGCSLAEAFRQFVLGDPEVRALSRQALELAPEFERVFNDGRCTPHGVAEWPVNLEYSYVGGIAGDNSVIGRLLRGRAQREVILAVDALKHRYASLIEMLQQNEIEAIGVASQSMLPQTIMRSFWSHKGIEADLQNGDVFSHRDSDHLGSGRLTKLWTGVMLQRPMRSDSNDEQPRTLLSHEKVFHVKPTQNDPERPIRIDHARPKGRAEKVTASQASIVAAIAALWPEGITPGISVQIRDRRILDWQKEHGLAVVNPRTIQRYLNKRNT